MKKLLTIIISTLSIASFCQTNFKPPFASKYNLYYKNYEQKVSSPSLLFKGDVVYVNDLEIDKDMTDPIKLAALEEIKTVGNYAFDGKKWRAVGKNLARQSHYLSHIGQTLTITGTNDTKVNFSLATDKLFENVTTFQETSNEFEILYTGYYEVSANIGFNAFRSDLTEPNLVAINVQLMKGNTVVSSFQQNLIGKQAGEWTLIKIPPTKVRLSSKDKISLVISRIGSTINGITPSNLGYGEHIGIGNLPQQLSKEIIIEKL